MTDPDDDVAPGDVLVGWTDGPTGRRVPTYLLRGGPARRWHGDHSTHAAPITEEEEAT
ncbi:hypothetical protein J4H86_21080 [Spiractinospora alimapuensis]|uniref:hypothetical protein n=1 Tax=Spiractinospora alimapuensis TaxID=2820884 RepID=UPI001F26C7AD|nr:hypothetical protein [Spiractinospora alimapuensis]QVQ51289.1 hypothetical protein J4H86_21080 [Spiractinospora alimapuensis]